MLDPFIRREIRDEVRRVLDVLLVAKAGETTAQTETIDELYPQMAKIAERPVMHPYGLVSRAKQTTKSVIGRVGEHTTSRIILGHMDADRDNISLNEGEVVLYNQYGQQIRLEDGKINLGENSDEPAVLGQQLVDFLTEIIDILIAGNLCLTTTAGNPTASNPTVAAQLNTFKSKYLTTASTNIVSQEVFLERTAP
jgi:phage gp45-like